MDSRFHTACRDWLERDAWYTTCAILHEFLRVTTNARVMRRPWSAPAASGWT
jgi:predicted nucleic acid-binding protein